MKLRRLSLILICGILLSALASCGTKEIPVAVSPDVDYPPKFPVLEGVEPVSEERIAEIEQVYREKNGRDIWWFNWDDPITRYFGYLCLGEMDGYTLLFSLHGEAEPGEQTRKVYINPLPSIPSRLGASFMAYKDGEWINLSKTPQNYILARAIHERFCSFEELLYQRDDLYDTVWGIDSESVPPLEECPYSDEDLIEAGFIDWMVLEGTYLGTYHGCIAFGARDRWDNLPTLYVLRNGELIGASGDRAAHTLFARGNITVEEYHTLIYRFNTAQI